MLSIFAPHPNPPLVGEGTVHKPDEQTFIINLDSAKIESDLHLASSSLEEKAHKK